MASNCKACSDLREYAPEFVTNGVTDNVFLSLENDNGLGNNEDHTDCDDLVDAVDCLVGNMDDEIEAYEVCAWKDYMHKLVPNLHQTIKAVIGSICGLWNNVCRLWCYVSQIIEGPIDISLPETVDKNDTFYCVAGKGISFMIPHEGQPHTSDIKIRSWGTNMLKITGSFRWFYNQFTEEESGCWNFDTVDSDHDAKFTKNRKGNTSWGERDFYQGFGELVCEYRINREKFPQIKNLSGGHAFDSGGGAYHCIYEIFAEGKWAYGQVGSCDANGNPDKEGYSHGHLVPEGWTYIQLRLKWTCANQRMAAEDSDGSQKSPSGYCFMRPQFDYDGGCGDIGNHENCGLDLHQTDME